MDGAALWASGSYSSSEDDFAATAYDSKSWGTSFGGDIKLTDWATAGVFVSYGESDTDTAFNRGGADAQTVSFGPYISAIVNEFVYVDASFGFSFTNIDNRRIAPGTTAVITGEQDATGIFGSANVNVTHWIDNLNLAGRVGVIGSNSQNDNYTDSTGAGITGTSSSLAQLQVEGQATYYFQNVAPFARVGYHIEASEDIATALGTLQPANDKDEIVVGGGVNLFGLGPLSGGVSYSKTLARENFDSWTVMGQVSYVFGGK